MVKSPDATSPGGTIGIAANNLLIGGNLGAFGGTVVLQSAGYVAQVGGQISAHNLFVAASGNIGGTASQAAQLNVQVDNLVANSTNGSVLVNSNGQIAIGTSAANCSAGISFVTIASGNIKVNGSITAGRTIQLINLPGSNGVIDIDPAITAGTGIVLQADSGLIISGNVVSSSGDVSLTTHTGAITVSPGMTIAAQSGNLLLQSSDVVTGSISIGNNAVLSAGMLSGVPQIAVVVGATPQTSVAGTAPTNVTVSVSSGGAVYFGANGITAACCSTITASGGTVIFNTNSAPSTAISLGSGVVVKSAIALPAPPGHGGTPPGHSGLPPGLNGIAPPGLGGSPGYISPPGLIKPTDVTPPGHRGTIPGTSSGSTATSSSVLQPVSYVQAASQNIHAFGSIDKNVVLWTTSGTTISENQEEQLCLHQGEVLISAKKREVVKVDGLEISLNRKCIALLWKFGNSFAIFNLTDARDGGCVAEYEGVRYVVRPGQGLSIDREKNLPGFAYRRATYSTLPSGNTVRLAEVSLSSVAAKAETLLSILKCSGGAGRQAADSVLKSAAAMLGSNYCQAWQLSPVNSASERQHLCG